MTDYIHQTIGEYDNDPGAYEARSAHRIMTKELRRFRSLVPDTNQPVLDAGCGFGRDTSLIKGLGLNVVGVDMSEGLLERAKVLNPSINFYKMDIRNMSFPDGYFVGIWCCAVLLHLKDQDIMAALGEFNRVLKDGGALAVSFMVRRDPEAPRSKEDIRHFNYKNLEESEAFVKAASFEIVESYGLNERERFGPKNNNNDWVHIFCVKSS